MLRKIAALLLVPVLLAGCSAAGDVETLLRAPQLSGESAALQKALNNYCLLYTSDAADEL